jgi:hypothetical protein
LNRPPKWASPIRRIPCGRISLRLAFDGSQSSQNILARYNADGSPLCIDHDDRTAMGIEEDLGDFRE